jgi:hypothetical protein
MKATQSSDDWTPLAGMTKRTCAACRKPFASRGLLTCASCLANPRRRPSESAFDAVGLRPARPKRPG